MLILFAQGCVLRSVQSWIRPREPYFSEHKSKWPIWRNTMFRRRRFVETGSRMFPFSTIGVAG